MAVTNDKSEIEPSVTQLDAHGKLNLIRDLGADHANRQVRVSIDILPIESEFRGSRKHVLSLLDRSDWASRISKLIDINEIVMCDDPCPIPCGHAAINETDLDWYIADKCKDVWPNAVDKLNRGRWWAPCGGTRPQMDLICRIKVCDKDGLLFVEAKAHEGELDWGGKPFADDASEGSKKNQENITRQIADANEGLNRLCGPGFNLSITSHYQLVNRITYLWKLANVGIPVVLLYLGFTGDAHFPRDYLRDERHWQRVMGGYMQGTVPHHFAEKRHDVGVASMHLLVRSLPITQ